MPASPFEHARNAAEGTVAPPERARLLNHA